MSLRRVAVSRAALARAAAVSLLACVLAPAAAAQSCTTSLTGTVYAPNGTDPLPNILVYVPTTTVSPMPSGLGDCATQSQLVSGNPLVSTTTDAKGNFTLTNAQLGGTQSLVIQAGKWRRVYSNINVTACQSNAAPTLAMPADSSQGDLPHIAISTGSVDALECVFRKIGISDSEFQAPGSGTGHIDLYAGSESPGLTLDANGNTVPSESTLVSSATTLGQYDMTLFACQGTSFNPAANVAANDTNVVAYANQGGRVFATHYSYVWLNNSAGFASVANWQPDQALSTTAINATIDQSFYEGTVLAQWLYYIGASTTLGQIPLEQTKKDQVSVNAPAQSWAKLNDAAYGNPVMQFTFDTPLNASSTTPAVQASFANSPANFVTTDPSDTITVTTANTSAVAADASLTVALTLPAGLTVNSLAGVGASSGWVCSVSSLSCNRTTALAAGATDGVTLNFTITPSAPLGQSQVVATLSGGGLSNSNQCGRVLFNEYHVENRTTTANKFPAECPATAMTPQEKFLEFSLYNLSNFIAPSSTDTITIQSPSITTITTNGQPGVQTPIYYGQIIGYTNGVNAIISTTAPGGANSGTLTVTVDGITACTLQNGGSQVMCPNAGFTGQNAGSHTVQAFYSGDTEYQPSQSLIYPETILQDSTTTAVASSGSPSVYGNPVTFTATVSNTAPFTDVARPTPVGAVTFFDNLTSIGSGTLNSSGVATFMTSALGVGPHTITAAYGMTTNFTASVSAATGQVVTLPISATSTVLTSSANPAYQGLNIMFSATVSQLAFTVAVPAGLSNPLPTGTVSFYDGTTLLGTSALNGAQTATLSISTLAVGTHNVTAVYSGDTANNTSTSAVLPEVVQPNTFTLTVNPTALNLIIGQAAPITVTITDNGNFNEPVQLACSGQSAETICTFGSVTVPAGGGVTTLTVIPQPPHNCVATASNEGPGTKWPMLAGVGVLLVAIRRRRKLLGLVSFGLLLAALPLLNGCGTAGCTDFGVYPGNYTFTVTATSAAPYAETQSQTMTMVVKP
jgi:hypothetical protein